VPTFSPIRHLQLHYFAIYAIMGSFTPFMPLYLSDLKGLTPSEIGLMFATGQALVAFMPVLLTFLADRYRLANPLLIALFSLNIIAMAGISGAYGFWICLAWITLNRISTQPQLAVGDGLFFSLQAGTEQPKISFSRVRVWGTVGFIFPSVMLFAAYHFGGTIALMPALTALWALFGIANASRLPVRLPASESTKRQGAPTWEAAKVLLRPPLAFFVLGVGFVLMSNMAYYGFYPIYLTDQVGIGEKWVGPISSLGVVMEILYMLNFERIKKRVGLEGVMALGGLSMVFRFACLAFLPTPFFAVFFQVFHGIAIIGFMVVPMIYLNEHAGDGYRNSIQGVYAMIVTGVFAVVGNVISGLLADISLLVLYRGALGFCLFGIALIGVGFSLARRQSKVGARE